MVALPFVKRTVSFSASGSYADGANPSSNGKYVVPVDANASPSPQILVRNDVTGNYDTRIYATGAGAVGLGAVAWNADDTRIYYGNSDNTIRYIKRTGTAFALEAGFSVPSAPRGIDIHPTASNFIASVGVDGATRFYTHTDAGVATAGLARSFTTTPEDIKFSPNGLLAAAVDRGGVIDIFTIDPTARTATFLQRITSGLGQGWHISWTEDSQHFAVGFNTGIACAVFALVTGSWTRIAASDLVSMAFPAISVNYISGGKLLLIQGVTASNWRVYERVGTTNAYVNRTADVTGYVPGEAYDGRNSKNGNVIATGGATAITIHDTPDMSSGISIQGAGMALQGFTSAGEAKIANKVTGVLGMTGFTASASAQFLYVQSAASMSPMGVVALVAAEKEDIITTRPIIMSAGAAIVEGTVPNVVVDDTPDPFIYGFPSMTGFTLAGELTLPLKINSTQSMQGFTSAGQIAFKLKLSSDAQMLGFTTDGEIFVPNGKIIADLSMQAFTSAGEIKVPDGVTAVMSMQPFTSEGEGHFTFKLNSEASMLGFTSAGRLEPPVRVTVEGMLPGFTSIGRIDPPVKITSEASLSGFTLSGSTQADSRTITSVASLSGFTVASELHMPVGVISVQSMMPFSAAGELQSELAVVPSNLSMSGFTLAGEMRRPWQLDANFSMKPFGFAGELKMPLDNTAVMNMQPFGFVGELAAYSKVNVDASMAAFEGAGELEMKLKVNAEASMQGFTSDGELYLYYKLTSESSMAPFDFAGELAFGGEDISGEMSLQGFTTAATIKVLPRRRHLRIIIDT